jgi:hypothetical protein
MNQLEKVLNVILKDGITVVEVIEYDASTQSINTEQEMMRVKLSNYTYDFFEKDAELNENTFVNAAIMGCPIDHDKLKVYFA